MKRLLILLALAPLAGLAFEFNVTVVWQNQGGNNPHFSANSLAEDGRVVGGIRRNADFGTTRAAIWSEGEIRTFEAVGFRTFGSMINRSGTMVGNFRRADDSGSACLWDADGTFHDLGLGRQTSAHRITDGGTILGSYFAGGLPRAYVLKNGERTNIPALDSRNESTGVDINDSELVVGFDFGPNGGYLIPWLWDSVNGMRSIRRSCRTRSTTPGWSRAPRSFGTATTRSPTMGGPVASSTGAPRPTP